MREWFKHLLSLPFNRLYKLSGLCDAWLGWNSDGKSVYRCYRDGWQMWDCWRNKGGEVILSIGRAELILTP